MCAISQWPWALLRPLAHWSTQSSSGCTTVLPSWPDCPHTWPAALLLWSTSTTSAFLPFRASFLSLPLALQCVVVPHTGGERSVATSASLAHSSMTVINTSTEPQLCINNNIPVWLLAWGGGRWVAGSTMTYFLCCQLLFLLGCWCQGSLRKENGGDIRRASGGAGVGEWGGGDSNVTLFLLQCNFLFECECHLKGIKGILGKMWHFGLPKAGKLS